MTASASRIDLKDAPTIRTAAGICERRRKGDLLCFRQHVGLRGRQILATPSAERLRRRHNPARAVPPESRGFLELLVDDGRPLISLTGLCRGLAGGFALLTLAI